MFCAKRCSTSLICRRNTFLTGKEHRFAFFKSPRVQHGTNLQFIATTKRSVLINTFSRFWCQNFREYHKTNVIYTIKDENEIIKNEIEESITEDLTTVGDVLRFTVSMLERNRVVYGQSSKSSMEEALLLIYHTLDLTMYIPSDTNTESFRITEMMNCKLTKREKFKIIERLKRRIIERVPMSYLTNVATIMNYHFYVDERVLIPRSYIAEILLSEELSSSLKSLLFRPKSGSNSGNIENTKTKKQSMSNSVDQSNQTNSAGDVKYCLDMCTGSGCLAIILADVFPNSEVIGVDISADALDVANINLEERYSQLEGRVQFIQSNMFQELEKEKEKYQNMFDIIVCNPPYVPKERMAEIPREYEYEPSIALQAEDGGLEYVKVLANESSKYLKETGVLIIEAAGFEKEEIKEIFPGISIYWVVTPTFLQYYPPNEVGVFMIPYEELMKLKGK